MNKSLKTTLSLVAIVAIIAIGFVVLRHTSWGQSLTSDEKIKANPIASSMSSMFSQVNQGPSPQPSAGRYTSYNDSDFAAASGTRILFFYGTNCPPCDSLDKSIQQGALSPNITIFKLDEAQRQKLSYTYGVSTLPSLVEVDDKGNAVKIFVARDEPTIAAVNREFGNR